VVTARELLARVEALGVAIELAGPDRLRARPADRLPPELLDELRARKGELLAELRAEWPPECLAAEERFGARHARLLPLLGCSVSTPRGVGRLVQVFEVHAAVVLGDRAVFFWPEDVRPVERSPDP